MSQVSFVKAQRAEENRAYVRTLLWQRQPGFAAALASAEQHLSCAACQGRRLNQDDDRREARCLTARNSTL
jgi:hypothetical protein